MTNLNDTASAAQAYIDKGWSVVRLYDVSGGLCSCGHEEEPRHSLKQGGKHPIGNGWQNAGIRDIAAAREAWARRPTSNIGIVTGRASGIWVLDVDPENGGDVKLAALLAAYGPLPETWTVQTGSGGRHYYWRMPDFDFTLSRGQLPVGLDVRGNSGQVVAPPSYTLKGEYRVLHAGEVVDAPGWLLSMIRPPERRETLAESWPAEGAGDMAVASGSYGRAAVAALLGEMAAAQPGSRNETAYRVGRRLAELVNSPWCGLDGEEVFAGFMAAAAACDVDGQFSQAEAASTLQKAVYGQAGRGVAPPPMPPEMSGTRWTPPPVIASGTSDASSNGGAAVVADFDQAGESPANPFTSPGATETSTQVAAPMINDISERPKSAWDQAVAVAVSRIYVNEEAKRQVEDGKFLRSWRKPITHGDLAEELALPETETVWRIKGLLPAEGNAVVVAPRKTGKTTLVGELIRSLADGVPFLGYACAAVTSVALFNYENTERQQRAWLRALGIEQLNRVHVLHLRGSALSLNVPQVRAYVTQWLAERAVEVWIPDPYLRAAQGIVVNENDNGQANVFTGVLDEIKLESGVKEIVMPAHSSNKNEIESGAESMRGAGRVEDWADAIWYLTSVEGKRFIRATGRDVELSETQMHFDTTTRHLSIGQPGHGRKEAALEGDVAQVSKVLREWSEPSPPGQNELADACGGWRPQRVRAAVVWLTDRNLAWLESGPNNKKYHHHGPKPQSETPGATGGAT